jgi:uncharacterized protein with von Willebrand factor type A (vWA) domain
MMRGLRDIDELERQIRRAMQDMDFDGVDRDLMEETLGPEALANLEELSRIVKLLEEAGLARRKGQDLELTPRAVRKLGEKALRDIFAELRKERTGEHDIRQRGAGSEQEHDTKPWEFGDPFLVDIAKSIGNTLRRTGPEIPLKLSPDDLEIHRTEALTSSATVIVMDMSRSMFQTGAFHEAKRVALALNTLIQSQYPRDYLKLIVFSYFAMELNPQRLLESDWVRFGGTNIQGALEQARTLLDKRKSAQNRQIILITDGRPTTANTLTRGGYGYDAGWGYYGYREGAIEETLKEVKRCTQSGIRINTFLMDRDPALMAFAQYMMRINKGRAFFSSPGHLGQYVVIDYLRNKRRKI